MNVLHFINNLNREGAQVMVSNLVTVAGNDEINYSVCVRQPGGSLVDELRGRGIDVVEPEKYFGFRSMRQSVAYLKKACSENRIQIIHAHMADAAFLGWLVARKLNLPLVISHHGQDILLKCNSVCRLVYYVLLNFAARYAVMNVAVSSSVAERILKLLRVGKQNVQVIANGVRIPEIRQLENRRTCKQNHDSSLSIVTVGRLVPLKGQRQLVCAVAKLVEHFPEIRLYIVGGGHLEGVLKELAERKKVNRHVVFTGAVDDVATYLAMADIYVSNSGSEGMPVSVLEAMAWRLPVIVSNIPGHKCVVSQGETGFLFRLDDVDDLVQTIVTVAQNLTQASSVAVGARLLVEQEFSVDAAVVNHARLYRSILG